MTMTDSNSERRQLEDAIEQSRRFLAAPHDTSAWLPPTSSQFVAQLQSGPMLVDAKQLSSPIGRSWIKVVCPYAAEIDRRVAAALETQSSRVEFVDVSGSPTAYWELIAKLWGEREDFVLVEADVVLAPDTINHLASCPRSWCSCPPEGGVYGSPISEGWKAAQLLTNRFRREIMLTHRSIVRYVTPLGRHWLNLDGYALGRLERSGERVHVHHDTPTQHLGASKTLSEWLRRDDEWFDYMMSVDSTVANRYLTKHLPLLEARCRMVGIPIPSGLEPRLLFVTLLEKLGRYVEDMREAIKRSESCTDNDAEAMLQPYLDAMLRILGSARQSTMPSARVDGSRP